MRPNALAFRLFAAAALWSLISLPLTAYALNSVFRRQVERDFDERLRGLMTTLVIESFDSRLKEPAKPQEMGEGLFKQTLTGWYWQIKPLDPRDTRTLISDSLVGETLKLPRDLGIKPGSDGLRWADFYGPEKTRLRVIERDVVFGPPDDGHVYSYVITGRYDEVETSVAEFRNLLISALAVFGAGLLAATFFQVRWGLKPLGEIERGLAAIRSGRAQKLDGALPEEIKPLQHELNALITSNQDIIERARTQVGNLAHALKTPLSVITNEARDDKGPFAGKVSAQAEIMRTQVNLYLDRARMAARAGVIGGDTEVKPVLESIARALVRINQEKGLEIAVDCPAEARFRGEKQDLEEMLGNLLDNAAKWTKGKVSAAVRIERSVGDPAGAKVAIAIEDDGPGLTPEQRRKVGKRGTRLDETKPGSGLGLSIVADLAGLYGGSLALDASASGGLKATLTLPAL
ncbi:MAG: HAMP domain-containing histidine kinase [Hyphomicrobiaceae bacterium]|nr:MAG: HAMP domain-containing histidine kinase [Hyphomicrobiaceae bacterium]